MDLGQVYRGLDEKSRQPGPDLVAEVLANQVAVELPHSSVLVSRSGKERLVRSSCAPIKDYSNQTIGVVLVVHDVTQQQHMEEELRKGQRIESLSLLAGGIAHDFNNILSSVLVNISLMKMGGGEGDEADSIVGDIEKSLIRARKLTEQLLTFAKGEDPVKYTTSLSELIEEAATFALRGSNVNCLYEFVPGLWPVDVDKGQMDDDAALRQATGRALNSLGYAVEYAGRGEEVLAIYRCEMEAGDPFDVVILDLTIPGGLGAKETIEELCVLNPQTRAIVSSAQRAHPGQLPGARVLRGRGQALYY